MLDSIRSAIDFWSGEVFATIIYIKICFGICFCGAPAICFCGVSAEVSAVFLRRFLRCFCGGFCGVSAEVSAVFLRCQVFFKHFVSFRAKENFSRNSKKRSGCEVIFGPKSTSKTRFDSFTPSPRIVEKK